MGIAVSQGILVRALRMSAPLIVQFSPSKGYIIVKNLQPVHYIRRNQAYIVNYNERANTKKPYASQVAESHVDTIVTARHKKTRKMQWTRAGAHHVLQIRAMIASDEWESKWQNAILSALTAVV
jgi:hypothetical protein